MDWVRILAFVTGMVDQELLARIEYLGAENRILKAQFKGRLKLSSIGPQGSRRGGQCRPAGHHLGSVPQPRGAFLVLGHKRRQLLWFAVTRNPTAEWLARQITEAFPWDTAPRYLIRDNDRAFGAAFRARVRAMGIRDRPTSFRSPWQNGLVERLIGSARHECTDHVIVFNEDHLRRILRNMPATIMRCGRTFRLARTHPAHAQSSGSETSSRSRSLVGYTIDMHESEFSEATTAHSWRTGQNSCTIGGRASRLSLWVDSRPQASRVVCLSTLTREKAAG